MLWPALALLAWAFCGPAFQARAQINTDQVVNVGRNAMYFDDYVLAIQYFNQAIRAKPYQARPYLYRAIAKINLDDWRGAEADASKAIELNPFITDAWEVRGVARQNMGNNRGAADDYAEALKLLPHNRQISFNLASALTETGAFAEADSTYAELLRAYPGFANGYLGRARLHLVQGDTIAATNDIDRALAIDQNSFNGHALRADIAMRGDAEADRDTALVHLNAAIRLQPRLAGLYVNRAYLNYRRNDWFAAMSDYDYALELDPVNAMALFNRGLLEMEVNANDKALEDFNKVLRLDPEDLRARYNRAVIYGNKGAYKEAIADVDAVIEAFPDFPTGYYLRSEYNRMMGNNAAAMRDYDKASAIARSLRPDKDVKTKGRDGKDIEEPAEGTGDGSSEAERKLAERQFTSLLTVSDNTDFRDEYNNSAIRGRVQDKNINIEPEPMMELTYYASPTETRPDTYYIKEVDDLNATRMLRMSIFVASHVPSIEDEMLIEKHFKSIDYYNSYLATHTPRAIDFLGRAMDLLTVRNYDEAVADLTRAIGLTPDFAAAYMLRAQANMHKLNMGVRADEQNDGNHTTGNAAVVQRKLVTEILDDLHRVTELSPRNAFAWYNLGNLYLHEGNMTDAAEAYDKALQIKPDLAEAYFNRGYVRLKNGYRREGLNDLSRAGELGVAGAYNLMKRLSD